MTLLSWHTLASSKTAAAAAAPHRQWVESLLWMGCQSAHHSGWESETGGFTSHTTPAENQKLGFTSPATPAENQKLGVHQSRHTFLRIRNWRFTSHATPDLRGQSVMPLRPQGEKGNFGWGFFALQEESMCHSRDEYARISSERNARRIIPSKWNPTRLKAVTPTRHLAVPRGTGTPNQPRPRALGAVPQRKTPHWTGFRGWRAVPPDPGPVPVRGWYPNGVWLWSGDPDGVPILRLETGSTKLMM